jgi:hypothetical protein
MSMTSGGKGKLIEAPDLPASAGHQHLTGEPGAELLGVSQRLPHDVGRVWEAALEAHGRASAVGLN